MKSNNTVTELFNEVYKVRVRTEEHKNYESHHYKTECTHEWKEYIGFTQRYNYCAKCDAKEY